MHKRSSIQQRLTDEMKKPLWSKRCRFRFVLEVAPDVRSLGETQTKEKIEVLALCFATVARSSTVQKTSVGLQSGQEVAPTSCGGGKDREGPVQPSYQGAGAQRALFKNRDKSERIHHHHHGHVMLLGKRKEKKKKDSEH